MDLNQQISQKILDLREGKLSCKENVSYFLSNIEKNNRKFNILLQSNPNIESDAANLDLKLKNKENLGSLFGICFLIKSNISFVNMSISCGSNTLKNYLGTYNADVIEKIINEDGLILGIVNNDEFASGSSGETSAFGATDNPNCPGRVPGGSSSGAAAAIAADFCDVALGSDTGGSIRNPASHCGIVGIKPSYGRVSRYGLVDLSMSLDQIGPLSKSIYLNALTLKVISGVSKNDPTTIDKEVQNYISQKPNKKYKIGIIKTFENLVDDKRISGLIEEKLNLLKKQGHQIIEVDVKNIDLAIQAYYPIVYTEFFSGTRKFDGIKYGKIIEESAGPEVLRRIFGGKEISRSEFEGAYYKKALKVKEVIAKEFERVFKEVDFIITPVTPMLPHKFGTQLTPEQMYAYDAFTIPANLAGICAGVISRDKITDQEDNVPVGIQVFADKFKEDVLFQALNLLENLS